MHKRSENLADVTKKIQLKHEFAKNRQKVLMHIIL